MTWWAEHGNQIGGAAAGLLVAGLYAATRYLGNVATRALTNKEEELKRTDPPAPAPAALAPLPVPVAPRAPLSTADELDAVQSSLRRARMEVDDLSSAMRSMRLRHEDELHATRSRYEEDLRRQRSALDERDSELARMANALVEERTRTTSLAGELDELRRQMTGGHHGTDARAAKPAVPSRSGADHRGIRGVPAVGPSAGKKGTGSTR